MRHTDAHFAAKCGSGGSRGVRKMRQNAKSLIIQEGQERKMGGIAARGHP